MKENVKNNSKKSENITENVSKTVSNFRRDMTTLLRLGYVALSPVAIIEAKDLKPNEKILLLVIISLSYNKGYCWASSKFLAGKLNISDRAIQEILAKLESKEYIKRSEVSVKRGSERHIIINFKLLIVKTLKIMKGRDYERQKRADREMLKRIYPKIDK